MLLRHKEDKTAKHIHLGCSKEELSEFFNIHRTVSIRLHGREGNSKRSVGFFGYGNFGLGSLQVQVLSQVGRG